GKRGRRRRRCGSDLGAHRQCKQGGCEGASSFSLPRHAHTGIESPPLRRLRAGRSTCALPKAAQRGARALSACAGEQPGRATLRAAPRPGWETRGGQRAGEPGRVSGAVEPRRWRRGSTALMTSRSHVVERGGGTGDWLAAAQRHFKAGEGATIVVEWAELII
ncbi:unnamed protein product, partial [Bubo scandiacus]